MPLNFDVIGYLDPDATVNVIRNGVLQEKKQMVLPTHLKNVLRCKNPRCISGSEQELPQIFVLTDRIHKEYRCYWCETRAAQL